MQKNLLWALLNLVFIVIFNVVFFAVGGISHPASVWIAYVFVHLAYIAVLVTPVFVRHNNNASVLGLSLYAVSAVYFVAEFVICLVFIFAKSETAIVSFVVQLILFGVYVVLLLTNVLVDKRTIYNTELHENETTKIKNLAVRVKLLIGKADDPKVNSEIERVYDLLHASPSRTVPEVYQTEAEIISLVQVLEMGVCNNDIEQVLLVCRKLGTSIERRNQLIKANQ
jgi:hypothetical protein